ncbi:hypothetical protein N7447_002988 [Penicillium robsamsonii]|uniref:uncharacterized protein n=1 Tax=Penicillium robsamsonii TaxID=1792511 RepID=UPI0025472F27|nr:uncharacterized protein N7447_002988 [Penicillium robsamsonii]KAJ5836962.1 hypothetical protein N7447_002988 [Penicillium robsamsonii]
MGNLRRKVKSSNEELLDKILRQQSVLPNESYRGANLCMMQESRCPHDVNIEESTELIHRLSIRTSAITGLPALINALMRVAFLRPPVRFTHSF